MVIAPSLIGILRAQNSVAVRVVIAHDAEKAAERAE
jgi:hypothetical protein